MYPEQTQNDLTTVDLVDLVDLVDPVDYKKALQQTTGDRPS